MLSCSAQWKWGDGLSTVKNMRTTSSDEEKWTMPWTFLSRWSHGLRAGWTSKRYTDELSKAVAKDDALTKFQVASFAKDMAAKPGQYLAGAPVLKLFQLIQTLRIGNRRTMYIGVTEADIYTGEVNFNFTSGWRQGGLAVAITSYARMKASSTNEQYESRKRLIERLAKELVPAALQQLGIPRPVDPADPYSYSDSTERLSQKTLSLSPPTRAALDKFRGP